MTVSRPDMKLRVGRRARLLLSVAALAVATPAFAQEQEGTDQTADEAAAAAAEAQANQASEAQKARTPYYLGRAPKAKRQLGPAIGAPKSILPQPFVAPGSLTVPPAPEGDAVADLPLGGEATDTTVPDQAGSEPVVDEPFTEGDLGSIDPSGLSATAGEAGLPRDFWQGYSRADIEKAVTAAANSASSPATRMLASRLLTAGMAVPAPETDADVVHFIDTRLNLLEAIGDTEGYVALVDRLPKDRDWGPLARHLTNAYLIEGRLPDACALAEAVRAGDSDLYWVRMATFCRAAQADREGVDFQLGILEELTAIQPTFYQLVDQILIEAGQAPGTVQTAAVTLNSTLKVDLLEATMARLAKVKVPSVSLDAVNPLAVGMTLALPGVAKPAKAELIGLALDRGWIRGGQLADFVRAFNPTEADQITPPSEGVDDRFIADILLAHTAATAPAAADRLAALDEAWARAVRLGRVLAEAPGLYRLTADMVASPDTALGAPTLARAALLDAEDPGKGDWFRLMRVTPPGANAALEGRLIATWPLMRIVRGDTMPPANLARLSAWWQGQAENPNRAAQANLVFTLLEAFGDTVPDEAWAWLEDAPVQTAQPAPSVAQWRRLLVAANAGDRPAVLIAAMKLMANGPAAITPALAGSMVSVLSGAGFDAEARAFAAEMLVAQGL